MNDGHFSHDPSMAKAATVGVMAQLRSRTSDQHAAIERVVPLMDAGLDRPRYVAYLSVMYRFHRDVEEALGALNGFYEALPDFDERRKQVLLERDLLALGADASTFGAATGPLPPLAGVAQGLGALYVLEGSTLGGRILSRHLAATLAITPDEGGAYLASYGERLSLMWRRFGTQLAAWSQGRDTAPVVDSARATFACLTRLLRDVSPR